MSSPYTLRVTEARAAARAEAEQLATNAELISDLVETFYGHIRTHDLLGPIFQGEIGEDWDPHLATMKRFWSAIVFHDGGYEGRPMPAHVKLKGLTPAHFETWLVLFEQTLSEIGATEGATAFFMERAHRIAQSFQLHIFHNPALTR